MCWLDCFALHHTIASQLPRRGYNRNSTETLSARELRRLSRASAFAITDSGSDVPENEERFGYQAGFAEYRQSSSLAGRTSQNRKGNQRCFPSHHRGRRRSFSTNPRVDAKIVDSCSRRNHVSLASASIVFDSSGPS